VGLSRTWDTIRNVGHFGHVPARGSLREVEEAGVVSIVRVAEVFDEARAGLSRPRSVFHDLGLEVCSSGCDGVATMAGRDWFSKPP